MKVIVIMSSYNGEKYIEEQINSILRQKTQYTDENGNKIEFELDIIVRDDGSHDKTIKILEEYQNNGKLKYYQGGNLGSAGSFFEIIRSMKDYDYYALSDQDDYWLEDKISQAIEVLEQNKCVGKPMVYGSNAQLADAQLKPIGMNFYPHCMVTDLKTVSCSCGFLGCTMVFNDEIARLIRQSDLPRKAVMHDFYITLLCLALDGKAIFDNSAKILYRQHGDNVCGASISIIKKIKSHLLALSDFPIRTVDEQAKEILEKYGSSMNDSSKAWLSRIANYRFSFINRICLALSRQYHFYSISRAIPMRLRIFLGKI